MKRAKYVGWHDSPTSPEVEKIIGSYFDLVDEDYDFLFNFGPTIFTEEELRKPKIAAINFHTASPKWPGRKSIERAVKAKDLTFGVTAHLMTREIDSGFIFKTVIFTIEGLSIDKIRDKVFEYVCILVQNVCVICSDQWRCKAYKSTDPI